MPTPNKPSSSASNTSRRRQQNRTLSTSEPSEPRSSDSVSDSSTENRAPLAERTPLPDWLLNQHETTPTADEATGSETSSERSPDPSEPSTNVWKPWSGEMVVPEELIPLFIRTNVMTTIQIIDDESQKLDELIDQTSETEELLLHTLWTQRTLLQTARVTMMGIFLRNPDEPMQLLVPDTSLVGPNGQRLRRVPEA